MHPRNKGRLYIFFWLCSGVAVFFAAQIGLSEPTRFLPFRSVAAQAMIIQSQLKNAKTCDQLLISVSPDKSANWALVHGAIVEMNDPLRSTVLTVNVANLAGEHSNNAHQDLDIERASWLLAEDSGSLRIERLISCIFTSA